MDTPFDDGIASDDFIDFDGFDEDDKLDDYDDCDGYPPQPVASLTSIEQTA